MKKVDSYRFLDMITKKVIRSWVESSIPQKIPWTQFNKKLSKSTVALISSGGLALKTDKPFDQEGERNNPWWGDPSFRIIPNSVTNGDIKVYHLHINPKPAEEDINSLLPIHRLLELEKDGFIGKAALSSYSFMGYILKPEELIKKTVPQIINRLKEEKVDAVVLIPA